MSFLSVDGKIMKCESGFPKREVNSLTFEVEGDSFPKQSDLYSPANGLVFKSDSPQSITVNYGDGSEFVYTLQPNGNSYIIGWARTEGSSLLTNNAEIPHHIFQDGNTGRRNITISFEDVKSITEIQARYIDLWGAFPEEINYFKNLSYLMINEVRFLDSFPKKLNELTSLREFFLSNNISPNIFYKIPDSFFDLNLVRFSVNGVFDLSDPIASNAFKINQFENLQYLDIANSNINQLDPTLHQLNLKSLILFG